MVGKFDVKELVDGFCSALMKCSCGKRDSQCRAREVNFGSPEFSWHLCYAPRSSKVLRDTVSCRSPFRDDSSGARHRFEGSSDTQA